MREVLDDVVVSVDSRDVAWHGRPMATFTKTAVSIAGAPNIDFHFDGDTCKATLVGAVLYCEAIDDDTATMRVTAEDGRVLADVTLNKRPHGDLTDNVFDVGSAFLWSHWRWHEAKKSADVASSS